MKYIVSHQGQPLDPLPLDVIVSRVRSREFDLEDYIYDESKMDWVLLMEFPELVAKIKSPKPPPPPPTLKPTAVQASALAQPSTLVTPSVVITPRPSEFGLITPDARTAAGESAAKSAGQAVGESSVSPHMVREWHVLKGENRFGPFTHLDVVKMLQQKVIFAFDFIWHTGLPNWTRLSEMAEFTEEKNRALFAQEKLKGGVFTQRKFPRHPYAGRVIVHNNISFWKGEGFEISRGGVGIKMSNSVVAPGQQVNVHFKQHENWPAFNAVCEVVSKKFVKDDSPVQYGMRFLSLSQQGQEEFYKKVA